MEHRPRTHPVQTCAGVIAAALKDVADLAPVFMQTRDKREALLVLTALSGQIEELRLRVLTASDDVADEVGARDVAAWLGHAARLDRAECRRAHRLGQALGARWSLVAAGLRDGTVNLAQAEVIVRALDDLPTELDPEVAAMAEERLVAEAAHFGPAQLRVLGRRILHVVDPEAAEDEERKALEREESAAAAQTWLTTRQRGDGTTDLRGRVADTVADRLLTYLQAFTAPRATANGPADDRRPYGRRLGDALGAFLETVDPHRLPLHGGDATTVIVTIDLDTLRSGLGTALVGDQPLSPGEVRRLACTASILPAVLGGDSQVLDLGRTRRLFSPAQRKALAVRDRRCRTEGCEIPAAWCEAHHAAEPWAGGGRTDLADGQLLCSFHHHRAHDHHYDQRHLPNGDVRFTRRT